jgi:hypothetical protein
MHDLAGNLYEEDKDARDEKERPDSLNEPNAD